MVRINNIFKNLFGNNTNTKQLEKINNNIKLITNYQEYIDILKSNANNLTIIVFTKQECPSCSKCIKVTNQIYNKYLDKIKIIEVKFFKDNTKNITSSKILSEHKIRIVPTYLIIKNDIYENIINENFDILSKRIDYHLKSKD